MTTPAVNDIAAGLAAFLQQQQQGQDDTPTVPPSGIDNPYQFFDEHLAPLFRRDTGSASPTVFWCERWADHWEALVVVDALWSSWEVLRRDVDMGMATWMRDFAYPLMGRLFAPDGTFSGCTVVRGKGHRPEATMALSETTEEEED